MGSVSLGFTFFFVLDENVDYFKKLVNLIEETYIQNGNKSVILIAHSMGGPMVNLILQKLNQKWKNKYVRLLLGLSGAWGGSVKTMKMYLVGKLYFIRIFLGCVNKKFIFWLDINSSCILFSIFR